MTRRAARDVSSGDIGYAQPSAPLNVHNPIMAAIEIGSSVKVNVIDARCSASVVVRALRVERWAVRPNSCGKIGGVGRGTRLSICG